jgi:ubiquinone/menaquinone biosynthesis C-methylase UbiE
VLAEEVDLPGGTRGDHTPTAAGASKSDGVSGPFGEPPETDRKAVSAREPPTIVTETASGELRTEQYGDETNLATRGAFNERFSTREDTPQEWLRERIRRDLPDDADLVEVGCGHGRLWTGDTPTDWTTLLTDVSPGMVVAARDAVAARDRRFGVADAAGLPVRTASVDAVVASMVLYHVDERRAALREFRRVLRPGGRLYATTVPEDRKATLFELMDAAAEGPVEPLTGGFTAENGAAQLRRAFETVERDVYDCDLSVTDAGALVGYVRTLPDAPALAGFDDADLPTLRAAVERRLSDGPLRTNSDIAVFVARRA